MYIIYVRYLYSIKMYINHLKYFNLHQFNTESLSNLKKFLHSFLTAVASYLCIFLALPLPLPLPLSLLLLPMTHTHSSRNMFTYIWL